MGMFDDISISDPLPYTQEMKDLGLDKNNRIWQTKDLGQSMSLYFIQGGKLFIEKYKVNTWVEGNPKGKSVMDRIGHLKREEPYLEEVPFHGEIFFYDYSNDVEDKWDCWIEFKATFTKGTLDGFELFSFKKEDNTERVRSDKKWKEELFAKQNLWRNKYIFNTKWFWVIRHNIWYPFWGGIAKGAEKIKFFI